MRAVFLDTVGLLAVFDDRDQWHQKAEPIFDELLTSNASIVTSELVLLECANAASRMGFRNLIVNFRETLRATGGVLFPSEDDYFAAWEKYKLQRPGQAGVVDLISFELMRQCGITEAFTNDVHFRAAGFVTLF